MASSSSVDISSTTPWEVFAKGMSDIRSLVSCKICTRLMYEPYTTTCGHTFCYGCLSKWLNHEARKRQCPDCRNRIKEEPSPDYTIRNVVHVLLSNTAFLEDGDTTDSLLKEQEEEARALEVEKRVNDGAGLFNGLFRDRAPSPVWDAADGVMRCPSCNFEIEGRYCDRCDIDFDDDSLADFSDYTYDSELELHDPADDLSDDPNEEDLAFIDDGIPAVLRHPIFLDDGVGTYLSPVTVGSDSEDLDDRPRRFDPRTGNERNPTDDTDSDDGDSDTATDGSDSDGSDSGDSEDSAGGLSEGSTDASSGEDDGSDDSSESDDEPRRPHRRSRQIPRRSIRPPVLFRPNGGQPRPVSVVDLTGSDRAEPTREVQESSSSIDGNVDGSQSSMTSTVRDAAQQSEAVPEEDSDAEAPVTTQRRKRERIVLSDTDEDEGLAVQREGRARRRRLHEYSGTISLREDTQRQISGEVLDPTFEVSSVPPLRSRPLLLAGMHPQQFPRLQNSFL